MEFLLFISCHAGEAAWQENPCVLPRKIILSPSNLELIVGIVSLTYPNCAKVSLML